MGDIEDSEITETEVTDVVIHDTIAFKSAEKGGGNTGCGTVFCTDNCEFHTFRTRVRPCTIQRKNAAIYFDTVHSQNKIKLKIDVSLSIAVDDKGDPVEIEELEFRNDNFVCVELDPHEHYW